ncbi:N-6 DNA methylase [Brachybacterium endophyticum]|uniref:N-6 DNA methylase n=1 Tax=Brachybacterium endophyticum TaxID=2182385 RepID=A0A2U2RIN6_9MICO|nr:methyltransferase [Brachybacterium endophyticum]PWH05739.1 N-6 DNA methylase [Brachybacterium endophyticum]
MASDSLEIVLEVLEGCAGPAQREAEELGVVRVVSPTELRLRTADLAGLRDLRCTVAAYAALVVPARRPRELLETSVQQRLRDLVARISRVRPRPVFNAVRLRAAGAHSPEMQRLQSAIAESAGLPAAEDGDLVVRARRGRDPGTWELLVRLTPRPLATRAWRTEDYPGAVNATIAASVLDLLDVGAQDELLDMTCGSGTFLIEQLHRAAPARTVGVDLDPSALDRARIHQRAARRRGRIDWVCADVRAAEIEGGFTRILTNPPWGTLHGDHDSNEQFHEDLLQRAAELAAPGARLGVLTHEIQRMHSVLEREPSGWHPVLEHRFFQKGHHPRLFLLERAVGS